MRVIGAGFGRTGTLSMKAALERLGFGPCHHMMEVVAQPGQIRRWIELAQGRTADWDQVLGGYDSCVDWPSSAYWQELAEYYPEAKVVLTVREPERWLASMKATILKQQASNRGIPGQIVGGLSNLLGTDLAAFSKMTALTIGQRVFNGHMGDDEYLLKVFTEHIETVKATIPAERLLVFEVKQGWEPLCEFLEVPVPEEDFPRVNDAEDFAKHARERILPLVFRRSR